MRGFVLVCACALALAACGGGPSSSDTPDAYDAVGRDAPSLPDVASEDAEVAVPVDVPRPPDTTPDVPPPPDVPVDLDEPPDSMFFPDVPDAAADAATDAPDDTLAPPDDTGGGDPDGGAPDVPADVAADTAADTVPDTAADVAVDVAADVGEPPLACDEPAVLPAAVRLAVEGEPGAEHVLAAADVAFDRDGDLVVVSGGGDLYRQTSSGERTLWVERVVRRPGGLAFLSTGELVVADRARGMLLLVYPGGDVRTLVPHLDAPSGVEVGRDDTVYVSEATRGAVVRVDPRTGRWERITDGMRVAPGALALAPDGETLYVVGAGTGTVYALPRSGADGWGELRVLATLPGAPGACDGKDSRDPCTLPGGGAGACTDDGAGGLVCVEVGACFGSRVGDPCYEWGQPGTCQDDGSGQLYCRPSGNCDGLEEGDLCELAPDQLGLCASDDWGGLVCAAIGPCSEKEPGAECEDDGRVGTCEYGGGALYCRIQNVCTGLVEGARCTDESGQRGRCAPDGGGGLWCRPVDACDGLRAGDPCVPAPGVPGRCESYAVGLVTCVPVGACEGKLEGEWCEEGGVAGRCFDDGWGAMRCRGREACDGLAEGDACETDGIAGHCVPDGVGSLACQPNPPCSAGQAGEACLTEWGTPGICVDDGFGGLQCVDVAGACDWAAPGDPCTTPTGDEGTCVTGAGGVLVCLAAPCQGAALGSACTDLYGLAGRCADDGDGGRFCQPEPPCAGRAVGDPCTSLRAGAVGVCEVRARGLVCQPAAPCAGLIPGAACVVRQGVEGTCLDLGGGGELWCETGRGAGAIRAIETDACGNLYVADDLSEALWRVSPDGASLALVASTPQAPVTGLAWGRGVPGRGASALYLAAHGGADVLEVAVGFPGRAGVRPVGPDPVPTTPPDVPRYDCLGLSDGPVSSAELGRARGYHDVAFDAEGYVIGFDGSALVRVDREDHLQLFASGVDGVEGMAMLPDGSLVVASAQGLVKIAPSGGQVVIAPDVWAYGVTVGPDGMVYAGDHAKVWRVDPETASSEVYLDAASFAVPWSPRTINFDLDASLMYIGTLGDDVYVLSVDEDLDPVGPPRWFATVREGVTYLDALAVDACGNLYVPNYESSALFRIAPDGDVRLYHQWVFEQYGHGADWGSGIGGWRADALYLPQPYDGNTVVEVVIGVPGRPQP